MQHYLAFILKERRVLSFGMSMTFFSSFGQTFLFALFVPFFLEEFRLDNSSFGTLYSLATLGSAMLLPILGEKIDRVPVRIYSVWVAGGLGVASLLMATSWNIATLFAAILMLRLAGQGLSGHTADTTMAKAFSTQRGKALSISNLGHPIGEGLLPLAIAGLAAFMYWRDIWWLFAFSLSLFVAPAIHRLIRRHPVNDLARPRVKESGSTGRSSRFTFNLFENLAHLRDPRMKFVLPAALAPPFWVTGFFLYQVSFGGEIGWSATRIASAFLGFAAARIASSLTIGPLIDRFSAHRLFPFYLLPLITALAIPLLLPPNVSIYLYMMMMGVSLGIGSPIKTALWAEMFGVERMGAIRSVFASLMIFGTSLSPFIMGFILDSRIALHMVFAIAIASCMLAMALSFWIFPRRETA